MTFPCAAGPGPRQGPVWPVGVEAQGPRQGPGLACWDEGAPVVGFSCGITQDHGIEQAFRLHKS